MPTIFENLFGYRFFFYSVDRGEPMHVHVAKEHGHAKYWMRPLELAKSRNFRGHQLNEIARLIEEHRDEIEGAWYEHFGRKD